MPGIGIAILLMLLMGFSAVWLTLLILTIVGFWKRKLWLKLLAGIPFSLLTAGTMFVLLVGTNEYLKSTTPEGSFEATFNFKPPEGTVLHRGSYDVMFDSGQADLVFQSDPKTIAEISQTGFDEISRENFIQSAPNSLWDEVNSSNRIRSDLVFYRRLNFRDFLTHDEALLVVNTNTGLVFFHWSGID